MAATRATTPTERLHRIARLTPDSPDPDARQDANNPALLAALEQTRRARQPGSRRTLAALEADDPLSPAEEEEAAALVRAAEAADRAAGVVEPVRHVEKDVLAAERPRRRASGSRPTVANGKVLLRLPLSVHQELIARAEAEQTSLNQLVLAYVSRGLGHDAGEAKRSA